MANVSASAVDGGPNQHDGQHDGSRTADGAVQRVLTRQYLVALGLIAGVILGGGWLLGDLVGRQEHHASVITVAGAQRMLSQRIALLATEVVSSMTLDGARARTVLLTTAMKRMRDDEARMTAGPQAPAHDTAALEDLYFDGLGSVSRSIDGFLDEAQQVLDATGRDDLGQARSLVASLRLNALGPLLATLQGAVALHEEAARQDIHRTMWIHRSLIILGLGLLFGEALFIFRPLSRRLGAMAQRLEAEAATDSLTGLLNRRAFTGELQKLLVHATGPEEAVRQVCVIVADLDWLKETNASEGQAGGDALITAAASALRATFRPGDVIGRLGGDEFAVAFHVDGRPAAATAAQRLRDVLHEPAPLGGRLLRAGASLGYAIAPDDGAEADALLEAANDAMTAAKHSSRGSIASVSTGDRDRLQRELVIRRSFDTQDTGGLAGLCAHLQPQLDIRTGNLVGLEALARWQHPDLGWLSPGEFLPLARKHGCLHLVGDAVRANALATLAALRTGRHWATPPRVALNLSHAELARDDVVDRIEDDLRIAGLPPSAIEIEITEEVLLDRVSDNTRNRLTNLRDRGTKLVLDDFGAGNAGLAQVLRLPLDCLKIDREFVRRIGQDPRAEEVIRATILLAHGIGLLVVGEGVETEEQLAFLRALDCDTSQGFLHAPALAPAQLTIWLARRAAIGGSRAADPLDYAMPAVPADHRRVTLTTGW